MHLFIFRELEEAKRLEEFEKKAEELARLRKEKRENLRKRRQNAKAPEKTEEELKGYSTIQLKELNDDDAVRPVEHKVAVCFPFELSKYN